MLKHRGFPSRLPSTDFQFTIRRANPKGATKLTALSAIATAAPPTGVPMRGFWQR